MPEHKHTPGPWLVIGRTTYKLNNDERNIFEARVLSGWNDNDERTSTEECEANARLICSAPDLLEALRDVSQALAWMYAGECRGFSDGLLEPGAALEKAEAAIAKATGQAEIDAAMAAKEVI